MSDPQELVSPSRTWLITGCSSGLGFALAERALALGNRVVVTARKLDRIREFAERYPVTCRIAELDVTRQEQAVEAVALAAEAFGRLDVVVNNAGYGVIGAFEELTPDQIARNFETNFFGPLALIRAALPILRAQKSGHIVNVSAAAAIGNYPGFSAYGASKWALEGASEALAQELKPLGIAVSLVQPGPYRTDFIRRSMERAAQQIDDYNATSGKFRRLLESMDGKQSGDPVRAAEAVLALVNLPNPPLRLVLGKYAADKARRKAGAVERECSFVE